MIYASLCSIVHVGIGLGDNPGTIVDEEAADNVLVVVGHGGIGCQRLHKALETAHVVDFLGAVTPRLGNDLIRIFALGLTELLHDMEPTPPFFLAQVVHLVDDIHPELDRSIGSYVCRPVSLPVLSCTHELLLLFAHNDEQAAYWTCSSLLIRV